MRLVCKKKRLWNYYKRIKVYRDFQAFQSVQAKVKLAIRKAKRKFEKSLVKEAKKSPKMFWAYMKQKTPNRQSIGQLYNKDRNLVNDDKEQANILNEFFSSVFTDKDTTNLPKSEQLYGGTDPLDLMCFWRKG